MKKMHIVIMLFAVTGMLFAQTPIPKENLISYWTGEPITDSNGLRADEYGSNHLWDAAISAVAAGKIGNATVHAGSTHLRTKYRTNTYSSGIQTFGRDITYAGWIQVDALQSDQVIASRWSRWAPAREFRLMYTASSGVLQLAWADSGAEAIQTIADGTTIEADTWYFVAFGRNDAANEISLSVTPDAAAAPNAAVTHSPAPTNPVGEEGELWFFYDRNAKTDEYGMFDEWAVYNKTLSTDELTWLFNGGSGRTYDAFAYVDAPAVGYFNGFEGEFPERGRISYHDWDENSRTTEQAKDGSYSLKCSGSWSQLQVFNDSNTDYWCPLDKCRVSVDLYMVDFVNCMLFQIDGKTTSDDIPLDTNEGIGKVLITENNGNHGFSIGSARTSGYDLPFNQWVHIDFLKDRTRTAPDNSMELYADGELILSVQGETAPYTPEPFAALAWHHISVGNDLISAPTFYLDNFEIAPDPWPDTTTTNIANTGKTSESDVSITAYPSPIRDVIRFGGDIEDISCITIYDRRGQVVEMIHESSLQSMSIPSWNNTTAPAGIYYYHINTTNGIETGSFIKSK